MALGTFPVLNLKVPCQLQLLQSILQTLALRTQIENCHLLLLLSFFILTILF